MSVRLKLRLEPEAFEAVKPLLFRMSNERLHDAYEVLVKGRDCGEVAKDAGVDYQIVHRAVKRVYERWEETSGSLPKGWVQVCCAAPAGLANAFLREVKMSRELMAGGQ